MKSTALVFLLVLVLVAPVYASSWNVSYGALNGTWNVSGINPAGGSQLTVRSGVNIPITVSYNCSVGATGALGECGTAMVDIRRAPASSFVNTSGNTYSIAQMLGRLDTLLPLTNQSTICSDIRALPVGSSFGLHRQCNLTASILLHPSLVSGNVSIQTTIPSVNYSSTLVTNPLTAKITPLNFNLVITNSCADACACIPQPAPALCAAGRKIIVDFNGPSKISQPDWIKVDPVLFNGTQGWLPHQGTLQISGKQTTNLSTYAAPNIAQMLIEDWHDFNSTFKVTNLPPAEYEITFFIGAPGVLTHTFNVSINGTNALSQQLYYNLTIPQVTTNYNITMPSVIIPSTFEVNFIKANPAQAARVAGIVLICKPNPSLGSGFDGDCDGIADQVNDKRCEDITQDEWLKISSVNLGTYVAGYTKDLAQAQLADVHAQLTSQFNVTTEVQILNPQFASRVKLGDRAPVILPNMTKMVYLEQSQTVGGLSPTAIGTSIPHIDFRVGNYTGMQSMSVYTHPIGGVNKNLSVAPMYQDYITLYTSELAYVTISGMTGSFRVTVIPLNGTNPSIKINGETTLSKIVSSPTIQIQALGLAHLAAMHFTPVATDNGLTSELIRNELLDAKTFQGGNVSTARPQASPLAPLSQNLLSQPGLFVSPLDAQWQYLACDPHPNDVCRTPLGTFACSYNMKCYPNQSLLKIGEDGQIKAFYNTTHMITYEGSSAEIITDNAAYLTDESYWSVQCNVASPGTWGPPALAPINECSDTNYLACSEDGINYASGLNYQDDSTSVFCTNPDGTGWAWSEHRDSLSNLLTSVATIEDGVDEICGDGVDNNCNAQSSYATIGGNISYSRLITGQTIASDPDANDAVCQASLNVTVFNLGTPQPNANVTIFIYRADFAEEYFATALTNAQGVATFSGVPATTINVVAFYAGLNTENERFLLNYQENKTLMLNLLPGICNADCTKGVSGLCAQECEGINGCSFYNSTVAQQVHGVVKGISFFVPLLNQTVQTCEGTPQSLPQINANSIDCPQGTELIIIERTVLKDGEPVIMRVPFCRQ